MNLLGELHRRHVLRVAAAYGVVAWLLIQVADVVLPRLGLPDWTVTFVIVLLALGFPLAVALSWAFDLTPDGIRRAETLDSGRLPRVPVARMIDFTIIAALTVAVVVLLARQSPLFGDAERAGDPAGAALATGLVTGNTPSILVLPFRNMSEEANNVYFAEGISEEIMNALIMLPQLRVVARASSFAYRDRQPDLRQVGSELDADYILDGAVRRQADDVRISVQLTDAGTGFNLWSRTFDEKLDDIFSVQREISQSVVETLKIELLPEENRRLGTVSTSNVEAYDLYLKGLNAMHEAVDVAALEQAYQYFESALRRDPLFAEAEAGKCQALNEKYRITLTAELIEQAIGVCNRAVAMNARSPRVQIALGNLYLETGRHDLALDAFGTAVELAPTLDDGHRGVGEALAADGRFERARKAFEQAIALAPDRARNHSSYAVALYLENHLEQAAEHFRKAVELDPDNSRHHSNLFAVLFRMGRFPEAADAALEAIEIDPSAHAYSNAGTQFFYSGDYQRAVELFRAAVELAPDDSRMHGNLGDACRMSESCDDWRANYRTAIELVDQRLGVNPDDAVARGLKGLYNAHLGKRDRAIEDLESALQTAPENTDVLWAAAVAWALLDDAEQSAVYARRAHQAGYPLEALRADPFIGYQGDH